MRIYLTDQTKNFPEHLELLMRQDIKKYDILKLTEKTTTIAIEQIEI